MQRAKTAGPARVWNACGASARGLAGALRNEAAFRQELLIAAVLVPLGLWLGDGGVEKALLVAPVLLVLVVELLNSAIEAVVDRIGPERHALSGLAKDLGSAAVSCALLLLALTWVLVLLF